MKGFFWLKRVREVKNAPKFLKIKFFFVRGLTVGLVLSRQTELLSRPYSSGLRTALYSL